MIARRRSHPRLPLLPVKPHGGPALGEIAIPYPFAILTRDQDLPATTVEPFQRLDRTRVDDHHSLGLSIAHDATLTANARAQGGLSIEIHFPLIPFAMPR